MSTKKNVICVFSLILYLLIACTILSNWIEAQMMTKVKISERQNRGDSFGFSQSALFADNDGDHLYEMIDGTGWSNGLRARELPSAAWYIDAHDKVQFDGSEQTYRFVVSASRQPQEGDKVAVVESFEKAEDQYLCIYTDGVPEEIILPKDAEIAVQSENVLLLNLKEAEFPFFEQTAKGMTDTLTAAERIYSLTDVEQFLEAVTSLLLTVMILVGGIILLVFTCILGLHPKVNKRMIRFKVLIGIGLLCVLSISLLEIDLPASMLPMENIFDADFYRGELISVFNALDTLKSGENSIVMSNEVMTRNAQRVIQIFGIIVVTVLLIETAVIVIKNWMAACKTKYVGCRKME